MVINGITEITEGGPTTNRLLQSLFGDNSSTHDLVLSYFTAFSFNFAAADFKIVCEDLMVNLGPDPTKKDPHDIWIDFEHGWYLGYANFQPCDPSRSPRSAVDEFDLIRGYIVEKTIYVCPLVLDIVYGRSLAPFKDQLLTGKSMDDYLLLPALLLHELLHTSIINPYIHLTDETVREFPPTSLVKDPTQQDRITSPDYLKTLPIVPASDFTRCHKLASEDPTKAILNADNVVHCALALYLHRNDWCVEPDLGIAVPNECDCG